jgi:Zn-dependent peptidase ImmA (M78 family)
VLINEGVSELPVKVGVLCKNMGIPVRYFQPFDDSDGYSMIVNGQARIYVSSKCPVQRQRFTAAHELGHVLLGHTGKYSLVNREPDPKDNPLEQAANVFASRLLAPACVLWALDARTPEEIAQLCQISHQAAAFRAERMALLYARGKFLASPLERQVYDQFRDFIRRQKCGGL